METNKKAFLVRWDYYSSIYDTYLDDADLIKKRNVEIEIEVGDTDVSENDLAIILMIEPKTVSGVAAIGRFGSNIHLITTKQGKQIKVANVFIDFFFCRKYAYGDYLEVKTLKTFFPEMDRTGIYCESLPNDQVKRFVNYFVAQFIRLEKPNQKIYFNKKNDYRNVMCSYLNDFDPLLKNLICKIYDADLEGSKLTWNVNKISNFPKYCEDTESLRDILIPDSVTPYVSSISGFNEIPAEDLIIRIDDRYKKQDFGYIYKTDCAEALFTIDSKDSPPRLDAVIDENGEFKITNVLPFKFLIPHELDLAKEIQTDENDNLGVIATKLGNTVSKKPYVYRIVKKRTDSEIFYLLDMQLHHWDTIINISASFKGNVSINQRTEKIYRIMKDLKMIDSEQDSNWLIDPSGRNYSKGFLMNKSEENYFDDAFPDSPLSVCRNFINSIIENN